MNLVIKLSNHLTVSLKAVGNTMSKDDEWLPLYMACAFHVLLFVRRRLHARQLANLASDHPILIDEKNPYTKYNQEI